MQENNVNIDALREQFDFEGDYIGYFPLDGGHIHNTYVLEFENKFGQINSYLVQRVNTHVFKDPDALMENIIGVTEYLQKIIEKNNGDPHRETLMVSYTKDGKPYYRDENGGCWRSYNFIKDTYTVQDITPPAFFNAAKAFGRFQKLLADYPIETLHETIPNFHNTVSRFEALEEAIKRDAAGRAASVQEEIAFARAREKDCHVLVDLLAKGKLPLRVTHNDTKLNNVMFDEQTHEGICVVDLDTVMPGLSLYDFGDSIRYGANTAAEDERDLSKVSLDLTLYKEYTRGYLSTAGKSLTKTEVDYLPFSAKLMTYECGIRFLTDYLDGDKYFKIECEDHNIVRCHTQFKLVEDIEKKYDDMVEITQRLYRDLCQ